MWLYLTFVRDIFVCTWTMYVFVNTLLLCYATTVQSSTTVNRSCIALGYKGHGNTNWYFFRISELYNIKNKVNNECTFNAFDFLTLNTSLINSWLACIVNVTSVGAHSYDHYFQQLVYYLFVTEDKYSRNLILLLRNRNVYNIPTFHWLRLKK